MTNPQDPNKGICWRVEYDDAAGVHHPIENVAKYCGSRISPKYGYHETIISTTRIYKTTNSE